MVKRAARRLRVRVTIQRALILIQDRVGENELVTLWNSNAGPLVLVPTGSVSVPESCNEIVARRVFVTSAGSDGSHSYESTVNAPTTAENSAACTGTRDLG